MISRDFLKETAIPFCGTRKQARGKERREADWANSGKHPCKGLETRNSLWDVKNRRDRQVGRWSLVGDTLYKPRNMTHILWRTVSKDSKAARWDKILKRQ